MTHQHGEAFLQKVEEIRLLAKANRQSADDGGSTGNPEKLREVLRTLDDENLISIARAFNQFLNLTNIAEQTESTEQHTGSQLAELFERLTSRGVSNAQLIKTISEMRCDLVLTAHPTEITRRTLIRKYNRIADALEDVVEDKALPAHSRTELERLGLPRSGLPMRSVPSVPRPRMKRNGVTRSLNTPCGRRFPRLTRSLRNLSGKQPVQHCP